MQTEPHIQPVLLSGGSGTRLWPLSRSAYPKQYIRLNSSSNFSCLQRTQTRLSGIRNLEDSIIICNEEQRFIAAEQMREIKIKPKSIILENEGRNTAPAVAIAALKAIEDGKDPILLILSSDHEIKESSNINALCILDNGNPLDISQLAALIKDSSFVIANDTGPAHMAAHLGCKGIALFGSHTTAFKVSIERENFKTIQVADLAKLSPEKVLERLNSLL